MTSYHGGKQRIGKDIAKVIWESTKDNKGLKGYCEPFCGMLGVYQHIVDLFNDYEGKPFTYLAGDINRSVIMMWNAVKRGWKPPRKITRRGYEKLKKEGKASPLRGFVGHQYSFGGQYFGGMYNKSTSYPKAAERVEQIGRKMRKAKVKFTYGSYTQFSNLKKFIIYCDPPYKSISLYFDEKRNLHSFDHDAFWDWCRKMSKYNIVLISEFVAPEDFVVISAWGHKQTIMGKGYEQKEKLFIHQSLI